MLTQLMITLEMQQSLRVITDMAFNSIDDDHSDSLDVTEIQEIMNQVALSVTNYNPFLKNVYNQVVNNLKHKEYIALHLRFGDWHKNMNVITSSNNSIESNISAWLAKHNMSKVPLYIMTDRKDNPFFQSLKSQYEVVMIDELISQRVKLMLKNKYKNTGLAEFLIQKKICENAKIKQNVKIKR